MKEGGEGIKNGKEEFSKVLGGTNMINPFITTRRLRDDRRK
jgi:hypothetical protein